MKWLIEYDRSRWDETFIDDLCSILDYENCEYRITKYIPFGGGSYNFYSNDDEVIVFGSINLIKLLQQEKKWKPLAYCDWKILDYRYYYEQYHLYTILNFPIFTTVGEFLNNPYEFFILHSNAFIKPTRNDKKFNGDVIHIDEIKSFCDFINDLITSNLLHPNEPIFISGVNKNIQREYRLVISNKEIITGSMYRENGEHIEKRIDYSPKLQKFIDKNIEWEPHPIYVMDIAELDDNTFKIIEIGSVNCAGLYESNARKVYDTIKQKEE